MSRHREKCCCVNKDEEKALLAKLKDDYCKRKCILLDAIKECERRCKALKDELDQLERCYEKDKKAIKRKYR